MVFDDWGVGVPLLGEQVWDLGGTAVERAEDLGRLLCKQFGETVFSAMAAAEGRWAGPLAGQDFTAHTSSPGKPARSGSPVSTRKAMASALPGPKGWRPVAAKARSAPQAKDVPRRPGGAVTFAGLQVAMDHPGRVHGRRRTGGACGEQVQLDPVQLPMRRRVLAESRAGHVGGGQPRGLRLGIGSSSGTRHGPETRRSACPSRRNRPGTAHPPPAPHGPPSPPPARLAPPPLRTPCPSRPRPAPRPPGSGRSGRDPKHDGQRSATRTTTPAENEGVGDVNPSGDR